MKLPAHQVLIASPAAVTFGPTRDLGRVKASKCSWGQKPSVWAQEEMLRPRLGWSGMIYPELPRQPNWEAPGRWCGWEPKVGREGCAAGRGKGSGGGDESDGGRGGEGGPLKSPLYSPL